MNHVPLPRPPKGPYPISQRGTSTIYNIHTLNLAEMLYGWMKGDEACAEWVQLLQLMSADYFAC